MLHRDVKEGPFLPRIRVGIWRRTAQLHGKPRINLWTLHTFFRRRSFFFGQTDRSASVLAIHDMKRRGVPFFSAFGRGPRK